MPQYSTHGAPVRCGAPAAARRGSQRSSDRSPRACARARLEEFVGQSHLLGEGSALRTAIEQGRPHSMVLYGPPGLGQDDARADRRRALAGGLRGAERGAGRPRRGARGDRARAAQRRASGGTDTVLFLDEIHRFNKAQQDALLPAVEEGLVTLIGATTENPAFEVNGALLSRLRVYALRALTPEEVLTVLRARRGARRASSRRRSSSSPRAAKATRAPRSTRSSSRPRRPRELGEDSDRHASASRTRCSAARSSTTRRATATTTTSRPGSRRLAGPIPTPRCTTSR